MQDVQMQVCGHTFTHTLNNTFSRVSGSPLVEEIRTSLSAEPTAAQAAGYWKCHFKLHVPSASDSRASSMIAHKDAYPAGFHVSRASHCAWL